MPIWALSPSQPDPPRVGRGGSSGGPELVRIRTVRQSYAQHTHRHPPAVWGALAGQQGGSACIASPSIRLKVNHGRLRRGCVRGPCGGDQTLLPQCGHIMRRSFLDVENPCASIGATPEAIRASLDPLRGLQTRDCKVTNLIGRRLGSFTATGRKIEFRSLTLFPRRGFGEIVVL